MSYGLNGAVIGLALGSVLAAVVWVLTGSLGWSGMLRILVTFGPIPVTAYFTDPEGWRRNVEHFRRTHAK